MQMQSDLSITTYSFTKLDKILFTSSNKNENEITRKAYSIHLE